MGEDLLKDVTVLPTQMQKLEVPMPTIEAEWHPKGGYFPTMNMVTEYGTFQDPAIKGKAGQVEMVMALNGSGLEFWHPDGRKFRFKLRPLIEAAAKAFMEQTSNPPKEA